MLSELELLLDAVPAGAPAEEYRSAVLEENVLMKDSVSSRAKTFKHLRELYLLDGNDPLFRVLRVLWEYDPPARPLLALLAAVTRDGLLRATSGLIIETPAGTPVNAGMFTKAVALSFPDRMSTVTLESVGRNIASSWTQSGHLSGRYNKTRVRAKPSIGAVVYALFLGYLSGVRGLPLYETLWARLLDSTEGEIDALAFAASQRGWLEYRRIGEVAEIEFSGLLGRETLGAG